MTSRLQRAEPKAGVRGGQPGTERIPPTREQLAKGDFVRESQDTVRGQSTSVAYRRRPLFETMAKGKGSGIDRDGLLALKFYREKHEESAMSPTRCALDVQARAGGPPSCLPPGMGGVPLEMLIGGTTILEGLEAAMGAVVDTMRAVALEDRSFSDIAIARWGSRKQNWIEMEKRRGPAKGGGKMVFVDKIVPKSGRHRERIRDEFLLGLRRLTRAHRFLTSTAAAVRPQGRSPVPAPAEAAQVTIAAPSPPLPGVDPEFLDERGMMRSWDEIAAIIRDRVAP